MDRGTDRLDFGKSDFETLEGMIERVTYFNEETGFAVAKVKAPSRREPVTVVGRLMSPAPGETLVMEGRWSVHPRYGEEFRIERCRVAAPASVLGIRKYLASGLIKGIGPVMAGRLVDRFGRDTLAVIENEPERLLEVEGLGQKRLEMIKRAWDDQRETRAVMIFLQEHGVSPGFAAKIYKKYGDRSVELVRENPYRLARDITGIGFLSADRIAGALGYAPDSPDRAAAGVLHVLGQTTEEGHVFFPYEALVARSSEMLGVDRELVVKALAGLAAEGALVTEDLNEDLERFRRNNKAVYLSALHSAETGTARRLKALLSSPPGHRPIDAAKAATWVQGELNLRLADRQVEAVRRAGGEKVLVITGGPGTGKTTIIRAVLAIFSRITDRLLLAAPTGRAAKRLGEATGFEARTIHRLLEYNPRGGFERHEGRPLEGDLLVVDEASMMDVFLMHQLLRAVPGPARLILVGDVDQLPSVGPGNVLGDVIASGAAPVVRLTEVFRQAGESSIIASAHRINQGRLPVLRPAADRLEDFYFLERPEPEEAVKVILELVTERIPRRFGFDPFEDIQVLSPMHRGAAGTGNLNLELQKALNPSAEGLARGAHHFAPGDKVMQVRNNYEKEVFNGDIGRLTRLDRERGEAVITYDGRPVAYDFTELDEIVLAYAVSVHKAQGSEYPAVVLPVLGQHHVMMQRNLIYTAVTRGRRLVVLVGSRKALAGAVANDEVRRRYTQLAFRLKQG
ncbi:MAG: ATP-dependent RecD-like DNA helicase [Thermodesulfobacteriota bacterium]